MHRMRWKYVRSPTEIILRACGANGALPRASGPQGSSTPQRAVRAETTLVHLEESRARGPRLPGQSWRQQWWEPGEGRGHGQDRVSPHRHQAPQRRWPSSSGLGLTLHMKGNKIRWNAAARAWGGCKGGWRLTHSCLLPANLQKNQLALSGLDKAQRAVKRGPFQGPGFVCKHGTVITNTIWDKMSSLHL